MVGNLDEIGGYSVAAVVIGLQASIDRPIAVWFDHEGTSEDMPGRPSVAHHQSAMLEDHGGGAEHPGAVRVVLVDRDIGDSACTQMSAVPQSEEARRRRAGHGGDFDQRIFT